MGQCLVPSRVARLKQDLLACEAELASATATQKAAVPSPCKRRYDVHATRAKLVCGGQLLQANILQSVYIHNSSQ